jgi:hypothetical protein
MNEPSRTRLETETIVVGYAMSRLDQSYLTAFDAPTWKAAFEQASSCIGVPPASFKNLRDEFDPVNCNIRKGWHLRPLRQSRQRVCDELANLSNDALVELVSRILKRDSGATEEAIDSLAIVTGRAYNVAERLLTGRLAEEYFLDHCDSLVGHQKDRIIDFRQAARGFDFGVDQKPALAIEVKGLKSSSGRIQFTDHEWSEAGFRKADYLVVVVGNLASDPIARIIRNPHTELSAQCRYQRSVSALWQCGVTVI